MADGVYKESQQVKEPGDSLTDSTRGTPLPYYRYMYKLQPRALQLCNESQFKSQ
jgi:hypothetical protein